MWKPVLEYGPSQRCCFPAIEDSWGVRTCEAACDSNGLLVEAWITEQLLFGERTTLLFILEEMGPSEPWNMELLSVVPASFRSREVCPGFLRRGVGCNICVDTPKRFIRWRRPDIKSLLMERCVYGLKMVGAWWRFENLKLSNWSELSI